MDKDLERFRELSFLLACDKLDEEEATWMRGMLARHPQCRAQLDADRKLVAQARAGLAERHAEAPPLVPLNAVLRACAPLGRPRRPPLLAWLERCWQARVPAPWLAGMAAVLVATVALQGLRFERADGTRYRGAETAAQAAPVLKVVFDDKFSIGALRALLAAQHLRVVRGPDEQGVVWLAADGDGEVDVERALAALRAQPDVLDAQRAGAGR